MTSHSTDKTIARSEIARPRPSFWRFETISQRLSLGFLLILLVLAGYGVVSYFGLSRVESDVTGMEAESMVAMEAAHLQRLSETVLLPVHDYLLTANPNARAQFEESAGQLDAVLVGLGGEGSAQMSGGMAGMGEASAADAASSTESSPQAMVLAFEEMDLLAEVTVSWSRVRAGAEQIFDNPQPIGDQEAIRALAALEPESGRMAAFAESLHQGGMRDVRLSRESVDLTTRSTSLFLILAVATAIAASVVLTRLITRAISRPMAQLTEMATMISLGELDTKVEVHSKGEVGELAQAVERMRTSLKMTIDRLSEEEEDLRTWTAALVDRELRRKVRGGSIAVGGHRYDVGRELDGQSVFIKLDLELREIVVTPTSGIPRHIPLKS
jgi:HAMP domain-containing protein